MERLWNTAGKRLGDLRIWRGLILIAPLLPGVARAGGLEGVWSPALADPPRCADEGSEGQTLSVGRAGFDIGEVHCTFAMEAPEGFTVVAGPVRCEVEGSLAEENVDLRLEGDDLVRSFGEGLPSYRYRRC